MQYTRARLENSVWKGASVSMSEEQLLTPTRSAQSGLALLITCTAPAATLIPPKSSPADNNFHWPT